MDDIVTQRLARLGFDHDESDDDDVPTYRSAGMCALEDWASVVPAAPGHVEKEPVKRCGPHGSEAFDSMVNGWDIAEIETAMAATHPLPTHDDVVPLTAVGAVDGGGTMMTAVHSQMPTMVLPTLKLDVAIHPHRIDDGTHGEPLVCSLRQFRVTARILDAATDAVVTDSDFAHLRASLVFADDGSPVPAQKGEAPLSGEIEHKRPNLGECTFGLRAAALTFKHGRRAFAVRIDAEGLASGPLTAVSAAIRSVARLPNESRPPPPPQPLLPPVVMSATGACTAPMVEGIATFASRPPAMPTVDHPPGDAVATPAAAAPARLDERHPTTVIVEDFDDAEDMEDVDDDSIYSFASPPPKSTDLMREMHMQSHTIESLLAQQQQMLHEIERERSRLRSTGGMHAHDQPCYAMCA